MDSVFENQYCIMNIEVYKSFLTTPTFQLTFLLLQIHELCLCKCHFTNDNDNLYYM